MLWVPPLLLLAGAYMLSSRKTKAQVAQVFGPFLPVGPQTQSAIDAAALAKARAHLIEHEGYRRDVYRDSEKVLTVGIGHKVVPGDNLVFGQIISDAKIEQFFARDIEIALKAARAQARDLRQYNADFLAALIAVNFQLGAGWPRVFKNTYANLKAGNALAAIRGFQNSLWAKQTPIRVSAFVAAIKRNYDGVA